MAAVVRDEECCSEDEHSPTDTSEDSVEVKVLPIALAKKNKRKLAEPRKVPNEKRPPGSLTPPVPPSSKRLKIDSEDEGVVVNTVIHQPISPASCSQASNPSPFRPWSQDSAAAVSISSPLPTIRGPTVFVEHPGLLIHESFRAPPLMVASSDVVVSSHTPQLVVTSSPLPSSRTFGISDHTKCSNPPPTNNFGVLRQNPNHEEQPLSLVLKSEKTSAVESIHEEKWTPRSDAIVRETVLRPSSVGRTSLDSSGVIVSADEYVRPHSTTSAQQNSKFSVESLLNSSSANLSTTTVWSTFPVPASKFSSQDSATTAAATTTNITPPIEQYCRRPSSSYEEQDIKYHYLHDHHQRNSSSDPSVAPPPATSSSSTISPSGPASSGSNSASACLKQKQRNYKNMTRERRIEANARERTRVHTISAAFDTLRQAVPSYSHNQKLSKLSILRIACSYILTLSRVAGKDYSHDQSAPSLADCVDLLSRTIQTEGKVRKKKDDC